MSYRFLVALPFVALALFWASLGLYGGAEPAAVYRVDIELVKGIAALGCALGGIAFGRGDYLRRAWILLGSCYLLILGNDILFRNDTGAFAAHSWAPLASGIDIFIANSAQLVGTVLIARTWRVAGLDLGAASTRRAVQLAAVALALVAAGWLVVTSARDLAHGNVAAFVDLFSSIADIVSFSLIAPFLLTAIALRGGSLVWTWSLLTASLASWLLFDATLSFGPLLLGSADHVHRVYESFRVLACTLGFAAGAAQRLAIVRTVVGRNAPPRAAAKSA